MSGPDFTYAALSNPDTHIRLLTVDMINDGPIRCRLDHFDLRGPTRNFKSRPSNAKVNNLPVSRPKYRALSYSWGDESLKVLILVNDKPFFVTSNLEKALRLASTWAGNWTGVLYVWIDAICINQQDPEERTHQVQRMRDIYSKAEYVVVWIGHYHEAEDDDIRFREDMWGFSRIELGTKDVMELAFKFMSSLASATTIMTFSGNLLLLMESDYRRVWASICRILRRAWFERLWVIQELQTARLSILQCGALTIPWQTFEKAVNYILNPPGNVSMETRRLLPFVGADRFQNVSLTEFDHSNILTILRQTRRAKCKDPRDRLFAISGITTDNNDFFIDYSTPVEQVYERWAVKRLQRTSSLDIFSACADSSKGGMPSWVPDLRRPWGIDRALFCHTHGLPISVQNTDYMAGGVTGDGSFTTLEILPNSCLAVFTPPLRMRDSIHAIGVSGDITHNLNDPTQLGEALLSVIKEWEGMCEVSLRGGENAFQPRDLSEPHSVVAGAFLLTLFRGYLWWSKENHPATLIARYETWRGTIPFEPGHYRLLGNSQFSTLKPFIGNLEQRLFTMMYGCQMFVTRDGFIGMIGTDCHAEIGDQIFALRGGKTPFILRQRDNGTYRLMGPCYVAGMMIGPGTFSTPWEKLIIC